MKKPLQPDTRHEPVFPDELSLEVSYSPSKTCRTVITRDANGRFRVRRQRWDSREEGHWRPDERGLTVAVSLEAARELALEKLQETPGGAA